MKNIFVGNLSFQATKEDLIKLFEPFGAVAYAVVMERKKGESRGFGFVEMPNEEQKHAAMAALEGKDFMGRPLKVTPVRPKVKRAAKPKRKSKPLSQPLIEPKAESPREAPLKEDRKVEKHSKIDRPSSKTWHKKSSHSTAVHNKDTGSRPYYGKKSREPKAEDRPSKFHRSHERTSAPGAAKIPFKKFEGPSKPWAKAKGGFKMRPKVSGVAKSWPKKSPAKNSSDVKGPSQKDAARNKTFKH